MWIYIYLYRIVLLKIKFKIKRDDFDFDIVNFPFLDYDVPLSTSSHLVPVRSDFFRQLSTFFSENGPIFSELSMFFFLHDIKTEKRLVKWLV